jgi:integrase
MSIYKRGNVYWFDFVFNGTRFQESTKQGNQRVAQQIEAARRTQLAKSKVGIEAPAKGPEIKMPTFREQSEVWLAHLRTRNRKPIPESSVPSIRAALNKWLLPTLGSLRLSEVNHNALRDLVAKMAASLTPKTVCTYTVMAKQIVESLANEDGQPIVVRKWDNDRLDLPIVNKRDQRRVTLSKEQIEALIGICDEPWERTLYILCCASGLRISEALALDREHLSDDFSVIYVRQQVKAFRVVACLKTDAAWRDVDLHPSIAQILK